MPNMDDGYQRIPGWVQILIGAIVFVMSFLALWLPDFLASMSV